MKNAWYWTISTADKYIVNHIYSKLYKFVPCVTADLLHFISTFTDKHRPTPSLLNFILSLVTEKDLWHRLDWIPFLTPNLMYQSLHGNSKH